MPNFEAIFVFLQLHPDKTALRNQLVTYVLGMSNLSKDELEDLITHIFSPPLKEEVMTQGTGFIAVAAQEAAKEAAKEATEKTRKEERENARVEAKKAEQLKTRTLMMRLWKKEVATDFMVEMTELKLAEVEKLIKGFNDAKTYIKTQGQKRISTKKLLKLTHLTEEELAVLLKILKEQK